MIVIYAPKQSPRFSYIVSQILSNILGEKYTITHDREEYLETTLPCINYSEEELQKGLWIIPYTLLHKTGLEPIRINDKSEWKGLPVFFSQNKGDIPFDLFSASFYLLTRQEEYHATTLDLHGRYLHTDSTAFRLGFLEEPVVDQWAHALKEELVSRYPQLNFAPRKFRFIPTIDIDHPFLYRNKGAILSCVCLLRDLLKRNTSQFSYRLKTILHLQEDDYFNFDSLMELYRTCLVQGLFFIHCGPYGKLDRRYIYPSQRYHQKIKEMASGFTVFLHPSYAASFNLQQLKREKRQLEQIIGQSIWGSRQHFLRFRCPESYRQLLEAGITHDYSMLYSPQCGFRAGTSTPFAFYDLEYEQQTALIIHPSTVMDVTLKNSLGMNPAQAINKIRELSQKVEAVGGDFITLFHNSSLVEAEGWEGWKEMYAKMVSEISLLEQKSNDPNNK